MTRAEMIELLLDAFDVLDHRYNLGEEDLKAVNDIGRVIVALNAETIKPARQV